MKHLFYPRLAWSGMRKNRKLYLPYLLSSIGMVMMFYIIQALSFSPALDQIKGGGNMRTILGLGKFVVAVFALIFLFYTNSFLVRRRYKEFGLFNILGMDKRKLGRVIFWESLTSSVIGLVFGIVFGMLFSKLAELCLLNIIHASIDYRFTVPLDAIGNTVGIFGVIFVLLMLKSILQVRRCKPLDLFHSETAGEKAPKANWVLAVLGLLLLGGAYTLAVSIQDPLTAILLFFVAVIMVIVATYLLFIAGSVALCKLLQKNKKSYYKKQNFVSVSTMAYRMKRNGAGLASICILATMVLVTMSSTSSLYFGEEDSLRARYPHDTELVLRLDTLDELNETDAIGALFDKTFEERDWEKPEVCAYRYASTTVCLDGTKANPDADLDSDIDVYSKLRTLFFVSVDDYNDAMGTDLKLGKNEIYLGTVRCHYTEKTISVRDCTFAVRDTLDENIPIGEMNSMAVPSLLIVVDDYAAIASLEEPGPWGNVLSVTYAYGYNTEGRISDDDAVSLYDTQLDRLSALPMFDDGYTCVGGCVAEERDDFYITYGGLFFLGVSLSIVFIFAAAMILYYKQLSEGYEDQSRFAIMQKVGMTKADIKKSINAQVLTVFFAPLLMAGAHLAFAFPLVWKMLQLFNLFNVGLVIGVTIGAFVVFGLFYILLYRITARAYYSIVSNQDND